MPIHPMGISDPRLMALVGSSITTATWRGHGKAWAEWCTVQGGRPLGYDYTTLLHNTLEYLMVIRQQGCSAVVAQRRLSGVCFHLLLPGGCHASIYNSAGFKRLEEGGKKLGVQATSVA